MELCSEAEAGVIRLKEHEPCLTYRLSKANIDVLSAHFGKYLAVNPTWEPGVCELKARQYVGTIVLDEIRIVIEPKVPLDNLFYMLTFAYDLPQFRQKEAPLSKSEDLFEFVVTIFVKQVERLVRSGLYKSYIDLEGNQKYLRGRLMVAGQLQQNIVRADRFYQQTNEYTANVLENRILLYTLHLLSRVDYKDSHLKNQTRRAGSAFQDVELTSILPAACDGVLYTRLNGRYRSSIHLAKLLLQHLSIEGHTGETPFAAYMLDMNQVFELFLARYLEQYFSDHPHLEVRIQDDIWLDIEQTEKGIPDIVLYRDGKPVGLLDTKYKKFKEKPSPEDRNQMLVYCHTLALNKGLLIYADVNPVQYMRRFHPQTTLTAKNLSLSGSLHQFRSRCETFAQELEHTMQL